MDDWDVLIKPKPMNVLDLPLEVESCGFEATQRMTQTGPQDDFLVVMPTSKMSGNFVSAIRYEKWLAFVYHRIMCLPSVYVPDGLAEAIKNRWLVLVYGKGYEVDEDWLDVNLDFGKPFDWKIRMPDEESQDEQDWDGRAIGARMPDVEPRDGS